MQRKLSKGVEINIKYKLQLRNSTILSRALFRNAQYNAMLRFMVQALQDPPLCSSTAGSWLGSRYRTPQSALFVRKFAFQGSVISTIHI